MIAHSIGLTRQQLAVLWAAAHGHGQEETARMLNISVNTVKYHLKQINRRCLTRTRAEAVHYADTHGLFAGLIEGAES